MIYSRQYIKCPQCQHGEFDVTILLKPVPDYISPVDRSDVICDHCGWCVRISVTKEKEMQTTLLRLDRKLIYILLKLDKPETDVFVFIKHFALHKEKQTAAELSESLKYWIETHTCPTNLIPVERLIELNARGVDGDPHGLFTHVNHIEAARAHEVMELEFKPGQPVKDITIQNHQWELLYQYLTALVVE